MSNEKDGMFGKKTFTRELIDRGETHEASDLFYSQTTVYRLEILEKRFKEALRSWDDNLATRVVEWFSMLIEESHFEPHCFKTSTEKWKVPLMFLQSRDGLKLQTTSDQAVANNAKRLLGLIVAENKLFFFLKTWRLLLRVAVGDTEEDWHIQERTLVMFKIIFDNNCRLLLLPNFLPFLGAVKSQTK